MGGFLPDTVRDVIAILGLIGTFAGLMLASRSAGQVLSIPTEQLPAQERISLPSLLWRCLLSPSAGDIRREGGILFGLLSLVAGAAALFASLGDYLPAAYGSIGFAPAVLFHVGVGITVAAVGEAFYFAFVVRSIHDWLSKNSASARQLKLWSVLHRSVAVAFILFIVLMARTQDPRSWIGMFANFHMILVRLVAIFFLINLVAFYIEKLKVYIRSWEMDTKMDHCTLH